MTLAQRFVSFRLVIVSRQATASRYLLVSRSHTLSKTGEGLVCLASSTCAILPKSGKSNQIAGKPIITFRPYVTSRIRSRTLVLA